MQCVYNEQRKWSAGIYPWTSPVTCSAGSELPFLACLSTASRTSSLRVRRFWNVDGGMLRMGILRMR